MKFIKVLFSNGDRFKIPATTVAHDRAMYYANHDHPDGANKADKAWTDCYNNERRYTLDDNGELLDWLWNNMNWADVQETAEKVVTTDDQYVYEEHWSDISEDDNNVEIVDE